MNLPTNRHSPSIITHFPIGSPPLFPTFERLFVYAESASFPSKLQVCIVRLKQCEQKNFLCVGNHMFRSHFHHDLQFHPPSLVPACVFAQLSHNMTIHFPLLHKRSSITAGPLGCISFNSPIKNREEEESSTS